MDDHWNVPACDFDPTGQYDNAHPFIRDPFVTNKVTPRHVDHIRPGVHSSELFAGAAIDFLQSHDGHSPFFMYVSFMAPHDPRTMPREYLDMYDPATVTLPENYMPTHPFDNGELLVRDELLAEFPRTSDEIRRHVAEYYAMISHLDAQIGRILAALDARGWTDNTLVVLAGDNGLAIGRHGLMGKQNLYDHSLHVPLLMAGPNVSQGQIRDAYTYLLDIAPTLLDYVGVPAPPTMEGRSLMPALMDPAHTLRDTLYFAYRGYQRAVQGERYKLIEYVVDGTRTTQLFDRRADPWELHNLASDPFHAETIRTLRQEMRRWRDALDDNQPTQGAEFWKGFEDT
jgi:arylsulfatase A-like enzyme